MLILYGTRGFKKDGGLIADNTPCPMCGCTDMPHVIRVRQWFTLYYIPIFPFSTKYFRHCPRCGWDEENKSLKQDFIMGRRAMKNSPQAQNALPQHGQQSAPQIENPLARYGQPVESANAPQPQSQNPAVSAPVDPSTAYARALGYDPDQKR